MNLHHVENTYRRAVINRFEIYKSIFLGLPQLHLLAPHYEELCRLVGDGLANAKNPTEIVEGFVCKQIDGSQPDDHTGTLNGIIGIIERLTVIFDALEDAAFEQINDIHGPNSLEYLFKSYLSQGKGHELQKALEDIRVRLVLTAHPTQFYPGTILTIINELECAIRRNDIDAIGNLLLQLHFTSLKRNAKPTPIDEARSLIWYLENVFFQAVIDLQNTLRKNMLIQPEGLNHVVELGFWPGGDRDGNPNVTHHTSIEVARLLNRSILQKYLTQIRALKRKLTFDGVFEVVNDLEQKIRGALIGDNQIFEQEIVEQLTQVKSHVLNSYNGLYLDDIEQLILTVRTFGVHFASLDIRQDARIVESVFESLFGKLNGGWNLIEIDRVNTKTINIKPTDELVSETLKTIEAIKQIQANYGEKSCHRFILSNCSSAEQVQMLLKLFSLTDWDKTGFPVDIVPLFETINDLAQCGDVMETLYRNTCYRTHIARRGNKQTIMLGFSDGTKDGGYFAANWSIYLAKEKLTAISEKYGVQVVFFDGRGGPAARGGGKTHQFYAAQAKNVANREIQLTIQGQTISSNFGTPQSARYNIELLLSAAIKNRLDPSYHAEFKPLHRELMEKLMEYSREYYLNLRNRNDFIPYYAP